MAARLLVNNRVANKCLVKTTLFSAALILVSLASTWSNTSVASDRKEIRFYKINKDEITQRLRFTRKKSRQPGCHNFLRKARLHRAVQFAYKTCRVYAKKNCAEESIMAFYRDKEPEPTTELSQGYGWYPIGEHERGELVKSWYCE